MTPIMKKIILLFVSFVCVNVFAANVSTADSLPLLEQDGRTFFLSENSIGELNSKANCLKNTVKKQGMFFLRAELGSDQTLSIGYGGTTQIFLTAGFGLSGILDGFNSDRRFSLGTRFGLDFGTKWGGAIDLRLGVGDQKHFSYTIDGLDEHTETFVFFTASIVVSYKNWDFFMGYAVSPVVPVVLGVGYNFRSKKYWTYREEKEKEEAKSYSSYYSPQRTTTTISSPCPSHIKAGIYNENTLKERINMEDDGIVGIYESVYSNGYRFGVIKYGNSYRIIYMSGESSKCWEFGHVKAELRPSATMGLFKATWYQSYNFSANDNCIVVFDGVKMTVSLPSGNTTYIKMYPQQSTSNTPTRKSGTGWALGSGYIVTNNHVIEGARIISIKGIGGNLNTGYNAEVVATDKINDIAILKITDPNFKGFGTIPYAIQQKMADVGEDVFVLGYPLTQALGNEIKLTNGIVSSRTGYQGDISTYQISAPVQPGNSGGPMFDNNGNVIGIVVAGVPGAENVGYAIKTSYLKMLIESAGLNIKFPANNTIATLSLAEKVKRVKSFVFYIECSNK